VKGVRFGSSPTPPRKDGKISRAGLSKEAWERGRVLNPLPTKTRSLSHRPLSHRKDSNGSPDATPPRSVPRPPSTKEDGERSRRIPPHRNVDETTPPPAERGSGKSCRTDSSTSTKVAENRALSDQRNHERLERANRKDADLIGKYLPSSVSDLFANVVQGPDDFFVPQSWLLDAVREVAAAVVPAPGAPVARLDISDESLEFNSRLIESYGNDFEAFLSDQVGTTMSYGAEFRPIDQLKRVLGTHPNFVFFRSILENGMPYHFTRDLSEEERVIELKLQLARGNHKSAKEKWSEASDLLLKDVVHGFSMPVQASKVVDIKGAMVEPCGITSQFKLQPDGSRKLADRLTQDLSYAMSSDDASVNSRIKMDEYTEMIYGWCLGRVVHYIVSLRLQYPGQKIYISKYDYSDAYRRIHHAASAAVQSIIVIGEVAYIALRLTFGGSPNPPTWCSFSEMVTDLANEIMLCPDWDPRTLRSPAQETTPVPQDRDEGVPFAMAQPLSVGIPVTATARTDSFIDDLILTFLDTPENRRKCPHAVPLAIHVTSRPHAGSEEPVKRRPLLSPEKLAAEGLPVEVQNVLGWTLDTRRLLVILPDDKFIAWTNDTNEILANNRVTFKELESIIGRFNHVSFLIPLSRHFIVRLCRRLLCKRAGNQEITISRAEREDLTLWVDFLATANAGISMNRITHRKPSQIGWSDSCTAGLGGFTINGTAWRIRLPTSSPIYGVSKANNVFEFLAMAVTLWILVLECRQTSQSEQCLLILGDSTSALGWLYRASQVAESSFYHDAVALISRKIARLLTNTTHCLASQHLKGSLNVVADLLSYCGDTWSSPHPLAADEPDDITLTSRFHSSLPQLIPPNFAISPVPEDILCFVVLVLQTTESSFIRSRKAPTKLETASGAVGLGSVNKWVSPITFSSVTYPVGKRSSSDAPSLHYTVPPNGTNQAELLASVRHQWYQTLSRMPQAIWLRRLGTISNRVPFTSKAAPGSFPLSELSSRASTPSTHLRVDSGQ
jgi:hypothetical protein